MCLDSKNLLFVSYSSQIHSMWLWYSYGFLDYRSMRLRKSKSAIFTWARLGTRRSPALLLVAVIQQCSVHIAISLETFGRNWQNILLRSHFITSFISYPNLSMYKHACECQQLSCFDFSVFKDPHLPFHAKLF